MRTCPECGYGALVATDNPGELGCSRGGCDFTCAAPRPVPDGLEKARAKVREAKAKLKPDGGDDAA